ncbi:MAG: type II secretion system F family protein [Pseudomonadota bacterium]
MTLYHYRAVGRDGAVETGSLEVADEAAAVARLRAMGLLPIRLDRDAPGPAGGLMALLNTEITPKDALGTDDRIAFTRSLATLTGAGLPLDRALEMTRDLGTRRGIRAVAGRLLEAVQGGMRLADAVDRERAAFPPLYRSILRAGEAGAALESTLARLADTLEQAKRRQSELRSALIYPAFLLVTTIGSVAILLGYVVPSFQPLLADAGLEPPAVTRLVIGTGLFFERHWAVLLGSVAGLAVAARLALLVPSLRLRWHRAALHLPVLGGLWRSFETARLASLLGTLLGNGVALPAALRLLPPALGNAAFAAEVERIIPEVEAGRGLAPPLAEARILPPLALQLIQVGQESGQLTEMLTKTGEIFETEAKRGFDRALAVLTPCLTLLMGGLIALIVSSILFALFSINELAL